MKRIALLSLLLSPALIFAAPKQTGVQDQQMVVATYNQKPVTLKEVAKKYPVMFKQFDHKALQGQFQFQTLLTEQHTLDQLLTILAKKEGISSAKQYLEKLTEKLPAPTDQELQALYNKFKPQLASRGVNSFNDAKSMLKNYLQGQKKEQTVVAFVEQVKKKHNMKRLNPRPNFPEIEIDITNTPTLGDPKSPVRIVVISDFECPYCQKFHDLPQQLAKKFGKKISVSFKHLPLGYHKTAFPAAVAAVCAEKQKKFWPYHDLLFKDTKKHQETDLVQYATSLKLNIDQFKKCIKDPASAALVNRDIELAKTLNVNGTPTMLINGVPAPGFELKELTEEINNRLKGIKSKPLTQKTVVARYDNKTILWGEIVAKYPNAFIRHRNDQIEARTKFIGEVTSRYITERLLGDEAKALKLKDGDTFLKKMMSEVADPTDDELKQVYLSMKARFKGMSFEQVKPQLLQYQRGMKQQTEIQKKLQNLAQKYGATLKQPKGELHPFKINHKNAHLIGDVAAKHTIAIFSDFQCPYCSRIVATLDQLIKELPKTVKIYFHHFPLDFHPEARNASIATECAAEQKQFKAMHDKLFEHQNKLGKSFYIEVAKELKLNLDQFKKCIANPATAIVVDRETEAGTRLGVSGTPTLFIDGRPYKGPLSPAAIKAAIQ